MTGFSALPQVEDSEDEATQWAGSSRILGPKWLQLPALTVGLLGVQITWSVEMSQASPYLIHLGLSKSLTAIAFLAGPLSGLIVQPLIGAIADHSRSSFGRRRPFMLLGALVCATSILLLGFTRQFVSIFTSRGSSTNDTLTIVFAVIALYGIDFSVNAVMAVDRALIVDIVPLESQPAANAWAARMMGLGSVIGFFIGNVELAQALPFLGNTEIQALSALSAITLIGCQLLTAASVRERVLLSSSKTKKSLKGEIKEIWSNILTLPRIIRQICIIQFLAWLAWFPVLFYTTVYVGDLFKSDNNIPSTGTSSEAQDDEATIIGSRAMFYNGVMALAANFILPLFVKGENSSGDVRRSTSPLIRILESLKRFRLCDMWAASHLLFALCMGATFFVSTFRGATVLITLVGFSWAITQWAPFSLLGEEILASSGDEVFDDSGSIRLTEVRSARTSQEPILGRSEVVWDANGSDTQEREGLMDHAENDNGVSPFPHKHEEAHGAIELKSFSASENASSDNIGVKDAVSTGSSSLDLPRNSNGESFRPSNGVLGNGAARRSCMDLQGNITEPEGDAMFSEEIGFGGVSRAKARGGLQAKSGIIIGIHNLFIVIPQFVSTTITSIVFALSDSGDVTPENDSAVGLPETGASRLHVKLLARQEAPAHSANSVAIVFRLGGIAALVAFVLCWRLSKELKKIR